MSCASEISQDDGLEVRKTVTIGADNFGQLGNGSASTTPILTPTDVTGLADGATAISTARGHREPVGPSREARP